MSVLQKLTEGIVNRDLKKEGAALLEKWGKTGLLEGLGGESGKHNMARLLENQAKELLREASSMAGGDVEGFAAVAFPIVRRVFGGLVANELVSVQPMSLPSGLIFFMDFTFNGTGENDRLAQVDNTSLYGGGRVGQEITGGVNLSGLNSELSFYSLNNGYSSPTGSDSLAVTRIASGTWGMTDTEIETGIDVGTAPLANAGEVKSILRYDPGLVSGTSHFAIGRVTLATTAAEGQFNFSNLVTLTVTGASGPSVFADSGDTGGGTANQVRRLTQLSGGVSDRVLWVVAKTDGTAGQATTPSGTMNALTQSGLTFGWTITDNFDGTPAAGSTNAIGAVVGVDTWGLENNIAIPEIDLKVDSVSVTAITKKLKAKWTPELGQDLNAYHNLDAEVELTSILSEQIALEIDREIMEDLVKNATAGTQFWSRSPGLFVNRTTGQEVGASAKAPDFTGTVSEWYETLIETINDVSAQIHRKTLRGGANFIVTSPEVANIMEFTAGFRASVTADDNKGVAGASKVGSISKKFDIYVDPYFSRNLCLVGRKGNSFLESGYVYAPYVPLQVTPTIFGVEDFVPRKGVMTRYAKKMVRPDMYGLVVVRGLLGESGE
jgi:hypothetical protein